MITFVSNVAAQFTVNSLIAITVATGLSVVIGLIYYALLGRAWQGAASMSDEAVRASRSASTYLVAVGCYALLALALFGVAWHTSMGQVTLRASLIAAGLAWLGFIASTMLANNRFQGRPLRLTLINAGHWLLVIFFQAVVIGLLA
jgi:hypothetical protein